MFVVNLCCVKLAQSWVTKKGETNTTVNLQHYLCLSTTFVSYNQVITTYDSCENYGLYLNVFLKHQKQPVGTSYDMKKQQTQFRNLLLINVKFKMNLTH